MKNEADNPATWECVDETQISCQTLESYIVQVANGQHEHPKGFAILRGSDGFVSVMNNGHYDHFSCWPCPRGYKCDGTPESWLNARNIDNFTGVGAVQCDGNTYTFYDGQSECLTCPSGSSVDTTTHATCICDDSNAVFDGTDCVSAIHADPGYYVSFANNNGVISSQVYECQDGHYCPGGDFTYADADENGWNSGALFSSAGHILCPNNTYNFIGGVTSTSIESCIECPSDSTATNGRRYCNCDNDLIFDYRTNTCSGTISFEPGTAGEMENTQTGKHLMWYGSCRRGYYCPGTNPNNPNGYWTSDDIIDPDNNNGTYVYLGMIKCGDNQYSNSGSTSASDCKYCPTDNHGTGILSWNGRTPLCGCEDGFKWSIDLETCISASCPNSALNYAAYGSDNGALISFGAESYNDDCLGVWGVIDDARNLSIDNPAQIVAAGTSVMLCKQTQEGYYLGPCTRAVRMCDLQDFGTMYSAMTNGTLTAFIQTALGVSNYNDLFSNSRVINPSNGAANQTNLDVEGDEPGERCNPTTPYVCESGKYLNVLNENVCTYSTKLTTPALPVTSEGNTYWLMMSPVSEHDYPVVSGSENKLHIIIDNTTYSVYDGSVVSE